MLNKLSEVNDVNCFKSSDVNKDRLILKKKWSTNNKRENQSLLRDISTAIHQSNSSKLDLS